MVNAIERKIDENKNELILLDDLQDIRLPIKRIWQPDVTLYN